MNKTLLDVVYRGAPAAPWTDPDGFPWADPDIGERMLREHLSQGHDDASRRFEKIDRQVAWMHRELLAGAPNRVLDLGCGPGLYLERLAGLGHDCVGIDVSPAAIAYAEARAAETGAWCSYTRGDIRFAEYGRDYGLVMLLFGEFNTFHPHEAATILDRAQLALADGGLLLLEPHTYRNLRERDGVRSWSSANHGVFLDRPHLTLHETVWHPEEEAISERWFVIDGAGGEVASYAQSMQAYRDEGLRALLERHGFEHVVFYGSLLGEPDPDESDLQAVVARKRA